MAGKWSGFTLIELMATLAVLAIALVVGVPAFAAVVERARTASAYHLLTSSLAAARLAAIRRGTQVTVCPSLDGATCRGSVVWAAGWILYADPDGTKQPLDASMILQHVDGIAPGLALRSTNGRTLVRFTPNGWSYGSNLSIWLCNAATDRSMGRVVVNNAGRVRSEHAPAGTACPYPTGTAEA